MRASVDQEFCEAAGECVRLVPDVFATDPGGMVTASVGTVPHELEEDVRLAVDSCPRLAISVRE